MNPDISVRFSARTWAADALAFVLPVIVAVAKRERARYTSDTKCPPHESNMTSIEQAEL